MNIHEHYIKFNSRIYKLSLGTYTLGAFVSLSLLLLAIVIHLGLLRWHVPEVAEHVFSCESVKCSFARPFGVWSAFTVSVLDFLLVGFCVAGCQ